MMGPINERHQHFSQCFRLFSAQIDCPFRTAIRKRKLSNLVGPIDNLLLSLILPDAYHILFVILMVGFPLIQTESENAHSLKSLHCSYTYIKEIGDLDIQRVMKLQRRRISNSHCQMSW